MNPLRSLCLSVVMACAIPAWAAGPADPADPGPLEPMQIEVESSGTTMAPEPNATFLAGLGGLVLLFFVLPVQMRAITMAIGLAAISLIGIVLSALFGNGNGSKGLLGALDEGLNRSMEILASNLGSKSGVFLDISA